MPMLERAVFLDRDGVLNEALRDQDGRPIPPREWTEFRMLEGVVQACTRFRAAGYRLVCVTNQPDIARGMADIALINSINASVSEVCGLDQIRMCPHDDTDRCGCRKPKPGMLTDAALELNLDLARSVMVGDRFRDIEAGQAAGCLTVLIDYGYPERPPARPPDIVVSSLAEAADWLLGPSGRVLSFSSIDPGVRTCPKLIS